MLNACNVHLRMPQLKGLGVAKAKNSPLQNHSCNLPTILLGTLFSLKPPFVDICLRNWSQTNNKISKTLCCILPSEVTENTSWTVDKAWTTRGKASKRRGKASKRRGKASKRRGAENPAGPHDATSKTQPFAWAKCSLRARVCSTKNVGSPKLCRHLQKKAWNRNSTGVRPFKQLPWSKAMRGKDVRY